MSLKGVALVGRMRSGKDTVGAILADDYGLTTFSFGAALKRFAHDIFPWVPPDPKPRELYQHMNVMRDYDPDVWVRQLFAKIDALNDEADYNGYQRVCPVITDARQLNEVAACRAKGYAIIRVEADEETRKERMIAAGDDYSVEALRHVTETEIDDIEADYTINNGTGVELAALKAQVDELMSR
ncbi:adenylate kinase [Alkalihalobacillus sp. LMS6]|jgi:dephospho-CoA kinase|uniref:adenylate kinase n=1 Tax=Alkalihalobacillus sp. LMS6 TaxID=2924034 RepID=UPI0020D0FBE8|nr:adenylate kinase [Alkalihalobacillus sp. LMS6]UTR05174.1 adenylate kinase [Alkalihalobacillus sp. LMS6]